MVRVVYKREEEVCPNHRVMLKQVTAAALAATLFLPLGGLQPRAALADDFVGTSTPPVLTIHSSGGTINITSSDDQGVHVTGLGQSPRISRFNPNDLAGERILLPGKIVHVRYGRGWRTYQLPPRQFMVPRTRLSNDGVNVENPGGGDMSIAVPKRVGAIFINADAGDIAINKLHGPFIVQATGGDVRMQNVSGRGLIRTTSGNITLSGVGGDVHVQTATGAVTVYASYANSVDVRTDAGAVSWRFVRCGNGVYGFHSKQGAIHLAFRGQAAAQVDAQSDTGNVQNLFPNGSGPGTASVRVASAHALSMAVNGGGPEITATTTSGDITIEPIADQPLSTPSP